MSLEYEKLKLGCEYKMAGISIHNPSYKQEIERYERLYNWLERRQPKPHKLMSEPNFDHIDFDAIFDSFPPPQDETGESYDLAVKCMRAAILADRERQRDYAKDCVRLALDIHGLEVADSELMYPEMVKEYINMGFNGELPPDNKEKEMRKLLQEYLDMNGAIEGEDEGTDWEKDFYSRVKQSLSSPNKTEE